MTGETLHHPPERPWHEQPVAIGKHVEVSFLNLDFYGRRVVCGDWRIHWSNVIAIAAGRTRFQLTDNLPTLAPTTCRRIQLVMQKTLLTFVDDLYEDLELWYPKLRLEEAGYAMRIAALELKTCKGKVDFLAGKQGRGGGS